MPVPLEPGTGQPDLQQRSFATEEEVPAIHPGRSPAQGRGL